MFAGISGFKRPTNPNERPPGLFAQRRMQRMQEFDGGTICRLVKQGEFLLRIHQAEVAKDAASQATESARSHLLAVRHTVEQVYGEAIARDVAISSERGYR
jgi:hypothetical protein